MLNIAPAVNNIVLGGVLAALFRQRISPNSIVFQRGESSLIPGQRPPEFTQELAPSLTDIQVYGNKLSYLSGDFNGFLRTDSLIPNFSASIPLVDVISIPYGSFAAGIPLLGLQYSELELQASETPLVGYFTQQVFYDRGQRVNVTLRSIPEAWLVSDWIRFSHAVTGGQFVLYYDRQQTRLWTPAWLTSMPRPMLARPGFYDLTLSLQT